MARVSCVVSVRFVWPGRFASGALGWPSRGGVIKTCDPVCACDPGRVRVGFERTETLDGKDLMSDVLPSRLRRRHCSWLYSMIFDSQSSSRMNLGRRAGGQRRTIRVPGAGEHYSTMRSSSFRLARRAGEKTTISRPHDSARQAQKIAMLNAQRTRTLSQGKVWDRGVPGTQQVSGWH